MMRFVKRAWKQALMLTVILYSILSIPALSPHDALASPLASAYDCEAGPCLGFQYWNGATMGTSTAIDIHQIYCYGCSFGGQQFYVKLYSRLTDTNYAVQGYTEAGYQVNSSNNAYPYYYYCNNPPNSYIPDCHLIASVSLSDFGSKLRIKMTRNRQGAGNMLIQVWTDAGYNPAPMVVSNNMGGAYGTSLAYAGTQIKLNLEVLGCSCSGVSQGTYGMIHWDNNYWQYSNGTYQYQTANGNAGVTYGGPMSAYMQPFPNQSSTGGTFNTNCAC